MKRPAPGQLGSRRMVRCDYCGLHVPEEEAVHDGNRAYCSADHHRLAMAPESTRE
ncbi:MAG: PP0621 family protein [Ectothiorhodospira sp.]